MYNGPIRGGNRGGRDQFNWESVKADKDRVFYLGHSVKATVGRWQKDRDILWYTKLKKNDANELLDEREAVKKREENLMLEALGLKKPSVAPVGERKLEDHEIQELLRRGGEDGEAQPGQEEPESDRVKGLGFKPGNVGGVAVKEVLEGVGLDDPGWRRIPQASGVERGAAGGGHVGGVEPPKKKDRKEKKRKKSEKERSKMKSEKKSKKREGERHEGKKRRRGGNESDENRSNHERIDKRIRQDNPGESTRPKETGGEEGFSGKRKSENGGRGDDRVRTSERFESRRGGERGRERSPPRSGGRPAEGDKNRRDRGHKGSERDGKSYSSDDSWRKDGRGRRSHR